VIKCLQSPLLIPHANAATNINAQSTLRPMVVILSLSII